MVIYDDCGTFSRINGNGMESLTEEAIALIERLIEWSRESETYAKCDMDAHVEELTMLKGEVQNHTIDVEERDWYTTNLGFTFSNHP